LALLSLIFGALASFTPTAYCQDAAPQGAGVAQQKTAAPYSIKNDKLGESLAAWNANNGRADCDNNTVDGRYGSAVDPDVLFCHPSGKLTFANEDVTSETAWFYKGRLFKLEMALYNMLRLPPVMTALKEKFGEPSSHEATPLQNGFGARFEFHTWRWTNGISTIELAYSNASMREPPIVIFTLDSINNEITERQQKAKAAKASSDI